MKKAIRSVLSLIALSALISCSSTAYLISRPTELSTTGTSDSGTSFQTVENDSFMVYAEASAIENEQAAVMLIISNKSKNILPVFEDNIRIFGGNAADNNWDYLGHWSYSSYLNRLSEKAQKQQSNASAAGTLALLSLLTSDTYYYDTGYGIIYETYTPSLLTAAATLSMFSSASGADKTLSAIDYMNNNLFKSSQIAPESAGGGLIFLPVDKYKDYRIDVTIGDKTETLYFSRSDR